MSAYVDKIGNLTPAGYAPQVLPEGTTHVKFTGCGDYAPWVKVDDPRIERKRGSYYLYKKVEQTWNQGMQQWDAVAWAIVIP